jgi:hypothetical protein
MKIYLFAFTSFLLLYAAQLKAQQNVYADKVYLKNGSVFVCKIIYYQPNDTLKVEIASGQIAQFLPTQIRKIVMADIVKAKNYKVEKPYNFKERGLYDALSFALNVGRNSGGARQGVGIQNVMGYQFNRLVGSGIGVGYDTYYLLYGESNVLSVFGEYRGYMSHQNTSKYWTFAAGYGQPLSIKNDYLTNLKGSFMVQPTIGFRFGAAHHCNFFADLGFHIQQVRYENNSTWSENHYTVTYRRWILRGGILF